MVSGALIGFVITFIIVGVSGVRQSIYGAFEPWMNKHPGSFYAFFFLFTYLMATLFFDIRTLATLALDLAAFS